MMASSYHCGGDSASGFSLFGAENAQKPKKPAKTETVAAAGKSMNLWKTGEEKKSGGAKISAAALMWFLGEKPA